MATVPDIECNFDEAPLMLALGQIAFTQSPELFDRITEVKARMSGLGMPIAQSKQQVNFIVVGGRSPQIAQNVIWWFSSLDKKRAVAVAQNSVVLYDAAYSNFDDFSRLMNGVVSTVCNLAGADCFLTTTALRYLSGFASDANPSRYLAPGLRGLPTDLIGTRHFHHNYGFWCDTDTDCGGRLVLNVKTVHGNQLLPQDVVSVGLSINRKFDLPKEIDAVQLDIHETVQRKTMKPFDAAEIEQILAQMRTNIKTCFLIATTDEAHKKWKISKP